MFACFFFCIISVVTMIMAFCGQCPHELARGSIILKYLRDYIGVLAVMHNE